MRRTTRVWWSAVVVLSTPALSAQIPTDTAGLFDGNALGPGGLGRNLDGNSPIPDIPDYGIPDIPDYGPDPLGPPDYGGPDPGGAPGDLPPIPPEFQPYENNNDCKEFSWLGIDVGNNPIPDIPDYGIPDIPHYGPDPLGPPDYGGPDPGGAPGDLPPIPPEFQPYENNNDCKEFSWLGIDVGNNPIPDIPDYGIPDIPHYGPDPLGPPDYGGPDPGGAPGDLPPIPPEFQPYENNNDCNEFSWHQCRELGNTGTEIFFDVPLFVGDGKRACDDVDNLACNTDEVCVAYKDVVTNDVYKICTTGYTSSSDHPIRIRSSVMNKAVAVAEACPVIEDLGGKPPSPNALATTTPFPDLDYSTFPTQDYYDTSQAPSTTTSTTSTTTTSTTITSTTTTTTTTTPKSTTEETSKASPTSPSSDSPKTTSGPPGVSPSSQGTTSAPSGKASRPVVGSACCYWALRGECNNNPFWMRTLCNIECGCTPGRPSESICSGRIHPGCGSLPSANAPTMTQPQPPPLPTISGGAPQSGRQPVVGGGAQPIIIFVPDAKLQHVMGHLNGTQQDGRLLVRNGNQCMDRNVSCAGWARMGECGRNPLYMKPQCQVSCGCCNGGCISRISLPCPDLGGELCIYWAAFGECSNNPAWMLPNCAGSCNSCSSVRTGQTLTGGMASQTAPTNGSFLTSFPL